MNKNFLMEIAVHPVFQEAERECKEKGLDISREDLRKLVREQLEKLFQALAAPDRVATHVKRERQALYDDLPGKNRSSIAEAVERALVISFASIIMAL